jgi:hypothetical protein
LDRTSHSTFGAELIPGGAKTFEVGDVTRFLDRNHFASWTGTAPIDASSGEHTRHRLGLGGHLGDDSDFSATGSQPASGSSDKPLPGPADHKPRTALPTAS